MLYLIPVGLIFIFYYFNLPIPGFTFFGLTVQEHMVDVIPDIVGYGLAAWASWKFRDKSDSFARAVVVCCVVGVYTTALQIIGPTGLPAVALSAAELAGTLYVLKLLNDGVADLEEEERRPLLLSGLEKWRKYTAICFVVMFLCGILILFLPGIVLFSLMAVIAWAVFSLLYIIAWFRTAVRYHKAEKSQ